MSKAKKVNTNFFKKWSPDMSYIVGFFSADGYMTANKNGGLFWSIHIKEGELLERIRKAINSNHKIGVRIRKASNTVTYRLQIGSKEMYNDLLKLGFKSNKTSSMSLPKVPEIFLKDFVRGYFDGDGNVWVGAIHKDRNKQMLAIQTVFTSCSYDFLDKLRLRLGHVGIKNGRIRKGKGNYYRLVYSILSSLNLYEFMYNTKSKLYLKRKKLVFEKFIKMRP